MATSDIQGEFFQAVKINNVAKASSLLSLSQEDEISLDINALVGDQTPLNAAIVAKQREMTALLLEHGAKSDDALYYCIETGSDTMVRTVCEHLKAKSMVCLQTALSTLNTDVNFKPVSNPLLFAARENRHDIVKTLIKYGATLLDLQTILDHSDEDPYEQYLACCSWHQAISSEAYLLYASDDPIQAAIDAGKAVVKAKSLQQNHRQSDYKQLMIQLDQFTTRCFSVADSEHEIHSLLWNKEYQNTRKTNDDHARDVPTAIKDMLKLEYKQCISSTASQQFILDQWYVKWQDLSTFRFILWTFLVILFQPVLCLAYVIVPFKSQRLLMKTPYVCFLVHLVSRLYFLGLVMYITVSSTGYTSVFTSQIIWSASEERDFLVIDILTKAPLVRILIYLWLSGMTWHEIRELHSGGFWHYWKDVFNYSDVLQIVMYWASGSCWLLSIDKIEQSWGTLSSCNYFDIHTATTSLCGDDSTIRPTVDMMSTTANLLNPTNEKRIMKPDDPALIGDVFFSVATVLWCLALLRDLVVVAFVGPLRASFGGMLSDISRFSILFIFAWITFALGMTQIYVTYNIIEAAKCYGQSSCKLSHFRTFSDSLAALFWSLFDPIDTDDLEINREYKITYACGQIIYATFMVVTVVIMLNALIAMMNNTYTRVEEDSEVEWKFARANLMVGYMTNAKTFPPPFNLLPTLRVIIKRTISSCRRMYRCCFNDNRKSKDTMDEILEPQHNKSYKKLIETLVDRFVKSYVDADDNIAKDVEEELANINNSLKNIESQIERILQFMGDQQTTR